tara:strand:+ start:697 stop:939 length:243 start_codon:yes stop_codon:yes gene_type:complete
MPAPAITVSEGQRVSATDVLEATITFNKSHVSTPFVTIMLEPSTGVAEANTYISSISSTSVTVKLSSQFSGYIHMQAMSG